MFSATFNSFQTESKSSQTELSELLVDVEAVEDRWSFGLERWLSFSTGTELTNLLAVLVPWRSTTQTL
jgi:hypothetical protein